MRKILVIGVSHSIREAEALSTRSFKVISGAARGWWPNLTACEDMAARVEEAVAEMTSDNFCLVHCFDNIAYMARSEEGGDLPIRKFTSGDYHIEGELVLASKERLYMYFKNCLNIFKLLEKLIVLFLSPLQRYLYNRGLQFYTWNFNRNQTEIDRYWQKNNFLLFAKCLKMYSYFRICI